ncbi:acyltransferase [Kribbella sp. NPDC056951]|uniref:acyltransferase n=1 Tax=Kribbella sp. NPDC056951 TaxID=3345978 RepID=UPI0036380B2D
MRRVDGLAGQAKLWAQKWRWYERNSLPWNRGRIHWELMRRGAFARWPLQGNVLEALRDGRLELVEIGAHCMLANGCFVTDSNHRFDDPDRPVPWQGFDSKGPTRIGDNVWLGANVVVTSGVTIGERCVIGANSVVTHDIPPYSIAAGAPAKVLRAVTYPDAG